MTAQNVVLDPGEYELGWSPPDEPGEKNLLLFVTAEGSTPLEFFGNAIVQGIDEDGEMWRDWWVGKSGCPFRTEAIEILIVAWREKNGPIALFEVEQAFRLAHPPMPCLHMTFSDVREGK